MNQLEKYTNYLTEIQKTRDLRFLNIQSLNGNSPLNKTYFNVISYGFDFVK
jgi:hypothetical protein